MPNQATTTVYIGLGSNLGDRQANLRRALAMLVESPQLEVRRISSFLDNPAVGEQENAPNFLNAVAEAKTSLSARALLDRLMEIEQAMGRVRIERWEPRVIDLDLLLYGESIISNNTLIVPHPMMHERRFVLQPLAEIAPTAMHPVLQANAADMLRRLRP